MRNKFNGILEDRLVDGNYMNHYLVSIDIDLHQFDLMGGLTTAGMAQFWRELNRAIQKFDINKVTLRPRSVLNLLAEIAQQKAEENRKKLPTYTTKTQIYTKKKQES